MKEDFLHYVWKYNYFNQSDLKTTTGQSITIQSNGIHNHDSGPDFSDGIVLIDNLQWIGQIEIHIHSSDWYKHRHQDDINYENVILHVVWKEDKPVTNAKTVRLPTLELFDRVDKQLIHKYESLILRDSWIACANSIHQINIDRIKIWLDSVAIEKLENKSKKILEELQESTFHWEKVFYTQLFKSFGLKVNQEAFYCLINSFPFTLLQKYSHNVIQLEALLFGQAGMLSEKWKDDYVVLLKKEYQFIKHKHKLVAIPLTYWKFSKLRPANFPTIRIAQLATLIHKRPSLFSIMLDTNADELFKMIREISPSEYWNNHYRFDTESKTKAKLIGKDRIRLIFINCIAPVLFLYGKYRDLPQYVDKAIQVLESLPPEYLKKNYCDQFKCVSCQIGHQLLSPQKRK